MADETTYVVLKEAASEGEIDKAKAAGKRIWVEIDEINAERNTEAVVKATSGWGDEEKGGNYAPVSRRNFPVIPRNLTTKVVDEFGVPSTTGSRPRKAAVADKGDAAKAGAAANN